jgi:hypothetical protein
MTIPEYDVECNCDFCTEEREERLKASEEYHAKRRKAGETMTGQPQQGKHCKNEGRCIDFAFTPSEWREDDICCLSGCDGDTRSHPYQSERDKIDELIKFVKRNAVKQGIRSGWILECVVIDKLKELRAGR